jgi:hypothetical protein
MVLWKSQVAGPMVFVEVDDRKPSTRPDGLRRMREVSRAIFDMMIGVAEKQATGNRRSSASACTK